MSRFAKNGSVIFIEEPVYGKPWSGFQTYKPSDDLNLMVLVPHLPSGLTPVETDIRLSSMLRDFLSASNVQEIVAWYYSPMAISFAASLSPLVTVYDCMDELSNFKFAPAELKEREARLFSQADVVFTGGHHLFEAKKDQHRNIWSFPSSIDYEHFSKCRKLEDDPEDQLEVPHPRLGYYGVIDERIDIGLVDEIASRRPDWHVVLVGPIVKIDPDTLPRRPNIHYLGQKKYQELPEYLAGWDIAIMPFALNESTRFISPTKTPEYLAGGKYVVSTPITDVVNDYGKSGLVKIGNSAESFVEEAEVLLSRSESQRNDWLLCVDDQLSDNSWDNTWRAMSEIIAQALEKNSALHNKYLQTCSITL